ncbi:hypothetical protein [Lonepinella koalarum]|uniref:hypothetical protein n=1 Tax=Lonepinella koalarum TaxID=53417 RepID=UPI003F6DAC92
MKKLLLPFLISLALVGCGDNQSKENTSVSAETAATETTAQKAEIKAILPENFEDLQGISYSKNESGVVIFDSIKDLLEYFDYDIEDDKTLSIKSEKPPVFTISQQEVKGSIYEHIKYDVESAFVKMIFRSFAHTNSESMEIIANAIDFESKKILKKSPVLKAKVSRDYALSVLKAFTGKESFDDLVNLDTTQEYNVLGLSPSTLEEQLTDVKLVSQIAKAFETGKIN